MANNNEHLTQMSTDIETARSKANFSVESLTNLLHGGPEVVARVNQARAIIENEPAFDKSKFPYQNRTEQLIFALNVAKRFIEIREEKNLDERELYQIFKQLDLGTPLTLHYGAFIPVILAQGTPDQIQKWATASLDHRVIGCYAQTELSHGSNVMGLKTTATFDEKTDEFIINSPDLTAAKWWIGGLGLVSTHAAVQAQLIIKGKNYGPHLFIVPIRSQIDLKPLKGITVGDIGPKAYGGFSTTDNGFALFDHVRIPRDNMLMKFAKVTPEGQYIPPVHSKLSYGSMVKLRVDIVHDAGWKLAKATTIATRYCTVRRQFHNPPVLKDAVGLESQVISYSSVQHRLMPLLATAYGLVISAQSLSDQFQTLLNQLEANDASLLPEVHINSCTLKSWGTRRSADGLEECRKSMGGHGYSAFSGISELFATFIPSNTYEGDNFVLSQQTGRFLLKQLQNLAKGKKITSSTAEYLYTLKDGQEPFQFSDPQQLLDSDIQLQLFGLRSARLVAELGQQLQAGRAWSDLNMECWAINLAHGEYLVLRSFIQKIKSLQNSADASLAPVLKNISDLFALYNLSNGSLATFLSTSTIQPSDVTNVNEKYREAIAKIVEQAIPLTDSFGFSDLELNTALGNKDGRAYEALWNAVQKNPVNSGEDQARINKLTLEILHRGKNLDIIKASKL